MQISPQKQQEDAYQLATVDPGPDIEFEKLVGTSDIVKKYQELIYKDEDPGSETSDEHF